MAVEALSVFVNPDDTDKIINRKVISGGEDMVSDYMFHSDVMLLVANDERNAGIFIPRPKNIKATLYQNPQDMEGETFTDVSVIHLQPGQELRLYEEFAPTELWFVHNESGKIFHEPLLAQPSAA